MVSMASDKSVQIAKPPVIQAQLFLDFLEVNEKCSVRCNIYPQKNEAPSPASYSPNCTYCKQYAHY
jgi:hypothetical protein